MKTAHSLFLAVIMSLMIASAASANSSEDDQIGKIWKWGYDSTVDYYHWSYKWTIHIPFLSDGEKQTHPDSNGKVFAQGTEFLGSTCTLFSCRGQVLFDNLGTDNCPQITYPVLTLATASGPYDPQYDLRIYVSDTNKYIADLLIDNSAVEWRTPDRYSLYLECVHPNS